MRATGFFYQSGESIYLVTAAHNVVPTTIQIEDHTRGTILADYSTDGHFPSIDIFLNTGESWISETICISDQNIEAISSSKVDILLVEIDFNPSEYDYRIWNKDDLTNVESEGETLTIVGYDGDALPNKDLDYSKEKYCQKLSDPNEVNVDNPSVGGLSGTPLYSVTLDKTEKSQYDGLSGAPLIGDGLVGIHVTDDPLPDAVIDQFDFPEFSCRLGHFRSKIISQMTAN